MWEQRERHDKEEPDGNHIAVLDDEAPNLFSYHKLKDTAENNL